MWKSRPLAGPQILAGLFVVATGCVWPQQRTVTVRRVERMGVTNVQKAPNPPVVDQLVQARCSNAEKCDDVGPGKTYVSKEACTDETRVTLKRNTAAYTCAVGVDEAALKRCLSSVKNESCSISRDSPPSGSDCDSDTLCLR